jgi:hypothetical protein
MLLRHKSLLCDHDHTRFAILWYYQPMEEAIGTASAGIAK